METDNEKRRVAAKLREYASWDDEGWVVDCQEWGESVLNLLGCGETEGECYEALADLIEPPTQCPYYHSDRHRCSAYDDVVDRDALLALADEMEAKSGDWDVAQGGIPLVHAGYLPAYASRIREALGVAGDA